MRPALRPWLVFFLFFLRQPSSATHGLSRRFRGFHVSASFYLHRPSSAAHGLSQRFFRGVLSHRLSRRFAGVLLAGKDLTTCLAYLWWPYFILLYLQSS